MGLESRFVKFANDHKEREQNEFCGLMVIARSKTECNKNKTWMKMKDEAEAAKRKEREEKQQERRPIDKRVREAIRRGREWDVTGKYTIKCPVLQSSDDEMKELKLEIFSEDVEDSPQLFTKFNFGIIKGVMRFKRQDDGDCKLVDEVASRKRKRGDSDDGTSDDNTSGEDSDDEVPEVSGDEDEDEGSWRRSPTPEEFYLGYITTPSQIFPDGTYQWRGTEIGTSEIQKWSDVSDYHIEFSGRGVAKLEGSLGCDFHKVYIFTGVKVAPGRESIIDISDEWAVCSDSAHERARVRRWGRAVGDSHHPIYPLY